MRLGRGRVRPSSRRETPAPSPGAKGREELAQLSGEREQTYQPGSCFGGAGTKGCGAVCIALHPHRELRAGRRGPGAGRGERECAHRRAESSALASHPACSGRPGSLGPGSGLKYGMVQRWFLPRRYPRSRRPSESVSPSCTSCAWRLV